MTPPTRRPCDGRSRSWRAPRWLLAAVPALAAAQQAVLVDNDAALRAFAAQREPSFDFRALPQVEAFGAGVAIDDNTPGLRIAAVTEVRRVASTASSLQSPWREGTFGRVLVQGQWYEVSDASVQSWGIGSATFGNDRAILSQSDGFVHSFQVGRSTRGWSLMAGDVQPQFSTLGTSLPLRGVLAQVAGPSSVFSATAGTLAHTWQGLFGETIRPTYLRDVAALKLEYWADPRTSVFAAAQRFQDRNSGNLDPQRIAQPLVRGSGFSAGARYADTLGSGLQRELAGEWARSRSRAEGQPWQYGQARVLDGSLQWPSAGLRGGWHRIDPDYASPSSQAVAGLHELYVGADWRPISTLGLSADLRTLRSTVAAAVADGVETAQRRSDATTLLANLSLARWLPGLSADASHYRVDTVTPSVGGTLAGQAVQRYDRINLNQSIGGWSAAVGALRYGARDRYLIDTESSTAGWDVRLGRFFAHSGGAGHGWFNASLARQHQSRDGVAQHRTRQAQAWAGAQLADRWSANLALGETRLTHEGTGLSTRLRQLSLDARMALASNAGVTGFMRIEQSDSESTPLRYRSTQGGLQLVLRY